MVRTVLARDPRGFMWERALWLAGKHTGSTLRRLRWRMPESLVPVSAHLDSAKNNSEVLWFLTEVFAKYTTLTKGVVTRDNTGILGAHVMQFESASSNMSLASVQLWARLVPPVAATPAQARKLKLLLKKKSPQFHFCHCQNLTVPRRARLKFVHSSRLIQRKSLVSWWKKVEHFILHAKSFTHAMMHTTEYRFELSTGHVADNQLPVRIHAGKKTVIFDPIPTVTKQYLNRMQNSNPKITKFTNSNKTVFSKITNSNKTVFETVMQT